jgi:hypothetical protein
VSVTARILLIASLFASVATPALLDTFTHTYGFGGDPSAVVITLRVFDAQPGGRYLWEYTVENNSFDPNPGQSNGFSGFELFLPSVIAEVADVMPGPPDWDVNCCSGRPIEWDRRNSDGPGIMPGSSGIFSFTTLPRVVAVNNSGWFHSWQSDVQTDIVTTTGMHVPLVPGLEPIVPEPGTMGTVGAVAVLFVLGQRFRRSRG